MINSKRIALFVGITYVICWLSVLLYYLQFKQLQQDILTMVFLLVYMWIPAIVAMVLKKLVWHEKLSDYGTKVKFVFNPWVLAAWLVPAVLMFITILVCGIFNFGDIDFTGKAYIERMISNAAGNEEQIEKFIQQINSLPVPIVLIIFLQALVVGPTINAVAAFGEEFGWRGLLQKELAPAGFWLSSLIIGIIWGVWHTPLILMRYNYPEHPVAGVGMMILMCVFAGMVISYFRAKAGNVYTAAIFHGTFNAVAGLGVVTISGGNDLTIGFTGVAGIIVLAVTALILWRFDANTHPVNQAKV
ncbi:MAG: CPBP family intramembrane glutamic endopeptidase [Elusimicrobiota bacterium]